jgi:lipoyl(octanoyl) transferase
LVPDSLPHVCWLIDIGLIPYDAAVRVQRRLVEARKSAAIPDVLVFCEHPHVITLGRNGKREHLRASDRVLGQMNVQFRPTDRGGDITYHGPGQVVGYPVLDLTGHRRDVRRYVQQLEEVMIRSTADYGVHAKRVEGRHGIWVETSSREEKLAAIGVHLSRWVTSHGFAYNVSTDLRFFDLIVPCGISDRGATSLERLLGRSVPTSEVRERLAFHFGEVFRREMMPVTLRDVAPALDSAPHSRERNENILTQLAGAGVSKGIPA